MSRNALVEVEVEFLAETELAMQVSDGRIKVWLPKSQIEDTSDESVFIPQWLAEEKGLV